MTPLLICAVDRSRPDRMPDRQTALQTGTGLTFPNAVRGPSQTVNDGPGPRPDRPGRGECQLFKAR
ncbi:hypothetical protein MP228_009922 [Amoeboaphelidium protococcarum]|nr:hypothetical protein MP228_009922 [Amoeboaphelidium protococcarum]